ncbi:G-type lectin S-receptor-like serine/threonine-protein kinase At2g19130 [Triticum dicoccoides]|uniref:G-type lectin S-receptor-like serine/threonine-protein kinase At2g19130 n=1 Tax=Triticum dicoccoides TaxID=85692 RepID=UPI00188EE9CA|nr:G-type lectin S-receptor-like serine/threonine-protein kinase At2g19130 [Triticum dicoccoides]
MSLVAILLGILLSSHLSACGAAMDTLASGEVLAGNNTIISSNGKFALGFFQTGSKSSQHTLNWYLGIWFNKVPKLTPVWVANGDIPIIDPASSVLTITGEGSLVILNQTTKSTIWSAQTNVTANNTIAVLLNSGNFILRSSSNASSVLWQSFDYPTDTFLPGMKLGWDKVTGLNRRLVSRKNSVDLAPGNYISQLDPNGKDQFIHTLLESSIAYWSSGVWNGQYFPSILPEMTGNEKYYTTFTFVNNDQETYFTYDLPGESFVYNLVMDVSGRTKSLIWVEGSVGWRMVYAQPTLQCDVFAVCGPFTTCTDHTLPFCNCMKGFSIRSPNDWELEDHTGGCKRNTPLDCGISKNISVQDMFHPIACVGLPKNGSNIEHAKSVGRCAQVCLGNCTCTAYSYDNNGCFVWHGELIDVVQKQCNDSINSNRATLYLRLATSEVQMSLEINNRRSLIIGVAVGASFLFFSLLFLFFLLIIRRRRLSAQAITLHEGSVGITSFRYLDLQRATKNFSEKLGAGGFGSVFKGFLNDSCAIAVKRLDGACQGEKQFRAEVRSIGVIQHINLVKLIGFCTEGDSRLLVYEHMQNRSLDSHLFQSNHTEMELTWTIRYQIALGVARGLAYLHDSCQDCIIHCDIKPENILLDASFVPKIADFGMAKFLGRDFSRVLTTMRGTIGYLAPEWISGTIITAKVDVYSYGMILLELISGRRNSGGNSASDIDDVYFPVLVANKLQKGDVGSLVDQNLRGDVSLNQVERAFKVACWCIQDHEFHRPKMAEVVQYLEGFVEVDIPPVPRFLQAIAGNPHSEFQE